MDAEIEAKLKRIEERAEDLEGLLADIEELKKHTRYPDVDVKLRLADVGQVLGSLDEWFALLSTCRQRVERNPGQVAFAQDLSLVLEQLLARPWMAGTQSETMGALEWELRQAKELAKVWDTKEGGDRDQTKD